MIPLSRYLLVKSVEKEQKQEQSTFYLPDDVVINKKSYEVVEVIDVAAESKFFAVLKKGDLIVVEAHMLREIDVFGVPSILIEDNYVFGKW